MVVHNVAAADEAVVSEEGAFAASTPNLPVLQYFPVRGRAEPIRLCLAYAGQQWFEPQVDGLYEVMKRDLGNFPFRQLPRFIDGHGGDGEAVDIVQSMAILRHLGRKFGLYGSSGSLADPARVDMLLDGCTDIRAKLRRVCVDLGASDEAQAHYHATVMAPASRLVQLNMQGGGLASLELLMAPHPAGGISERPWALLTGVSIADFAVANLTDMHQTYFGEAVVRSFPRLALHKERVWALSGIKQYLESSSRHPMMWMSEWLAQRNEGGPSASDTLPAAEGI